MQYISNTAEDKQAMLKAIGVPSFEALIQKVPKGLRDFQLRLPEGISELDLMREMVDIGKKNKHFHDYACYLGAGNYDHFIPTVVQHLAHRGEFITSYTPYQGEASQGTLQSIYEFQSLMCELTGMDFSNASMYDGASSLAEAAILAIRSTGRTRLLVSGGVHPEYRTVVETYVTALDTEIVDIPLKDGATDVARLKEELKREPAAVLIQQPNFFGVLEEPQAFSKAVHDAGALLIACVNPISLGVLHTPGSYGADIAVGEGQPLGNPVSFGGPHFGFFTVKEDLLRKIPGRIAGMTVDKAGRRSFVLTLQAREQHIRREKATSNICTNHSLCALKAAIYLSLLGPKGLRKLALLNLKNAKAAYDALTKLPKVKPFSMKPFFNEFALFIDKDVRALKASLEKHKILGPLPLARHGRAFENAYLFAVTENRTAQDLERLVAAVKEA